MYFTKLKTAYYESGLWGIWLRGYHVYRVFYVPHVYRHLGAAPKCTAPRRPRSMVAESTTSYLDKFVFLLAFNGSPTFVQTSSFQVVYVYVDLSCPTKIYIPQRGVQWKQGVVIYMMLYTSLLYDTTPIHCTNLRLHPPVMNTHLLKAAIRGAWWRSRRAPPGRRPRRPTYCMI